ncbi:hypothetical protein BO82DRAFT_33859 [Aspergillus uvarum CBS 121591]|uniref:Uncharacterized protein n=1 Tax=Aspergillus uvarum CBS 121591 TaxID=1448315 RepID=A0A319CY28_9EURO|nr:hypothetical protein BO82DRAFT_33859 [Aspergillus uvarum CBS 121591]PYH83763.1 hypothetical protein BO82DRAFT_33859 [Aspergillus uvarum CBS 121591]
MLNLIQAGAPGVSPRCFLDFVYIRVSLNIHSLCFSSLGFILDVNRAGYGGVSPCNYVYFSLSLWLLTIYCD